MNNKLEIFKKKLIYRASYRGTKEMDMLLSQFVNKYINLWDELYLKELEEFLILLVQQIGVVRHGFVVEFLTINQLVVMVFLKIMKMDHENQLEQIHFLMLMEILINLFLIYQAVIQYTWVLFHFIIEY